jgi:hypothetical protein
LPEWWQAFNLAESLRGMGWPNITPDTVADLDPVWINRAMIIAGLRDDEDIKKAESYVAQRLREGKANPGQRRVYGHLTDVSYNAPGQPGDPSAPTDRSGRPRMTGRGRPPDG